MSGKTSLIKSMDLNDLNQAIKWAEIEGWNPGLHDDECFFASDKKGFFKGVVDDEMISSLSVVKYDNDFAFLGFYIVKPEFRGKGHGFKLWNEVLKNHTSYNIGLDGVVAQQENYKKAGFKLAYRNIRFMGKKGLDIPSVATINLSDLPFEEVLEYDGRFFPAQREKFLKLWISRKDTQALGIVENGRLTGYGVLRKCVTGYKIGPLFAETPENARIIFSSLLNTLNEDEAFFLDIPEVNTEALKLVADHNMERVFETARMYTKDFPKLPLDKVFGVTSFELG